MNLLLLKRRVSSVWFQLFSLDVNSNLSHSLTDKPACSCSPADLFHKSISGWEAFQAALLAGEKAAMADFRHGELLPLHCLEIWEQTGELSVTRITPCMVIHHQGWGLQADLQQAWAFYQNSTPGVFILFNVLLRGVNQTSTHKRVSWFV